MVFYIFNPTDGYFRYNSFSTEHSVVISRLITTISMPRSSIKPYFPMVATTFPSRQTTKENMSIFSIPCYPQCTPF